MTRRLLACLAVLAMLATACGSDTIAEQMIEGNDGITNVDINDDEVTVEFEDEDGSGSITYGGGEVPDGFPIPVPDGGSVQTSIEQDDGKQFVSLTYTEEFDALAEVYADWVADQDAENVFTNSMETPRSESWSGERSDGEFIISMIETPGAGGATVHVNLNWNPR